MLSPTSTVIERFKCFNTRTTSSLVSCGCRHLVDAMMLVNSGDSDKDDEGDRRDVGVCTVDGSSNFSRSK